MNDNSEFIKATTVLKYYGIEPDYIEKMDNVLKVHSTKGVFAVKKINPQNGVDFIRYTQYLYQNGYNRIVPIYPSLDGRYAILYENELYYLMPWMKTEYKGEPFERNQKLFRELARLHSISSHEIKVNKEERTEFYEQTVADLEQEKEFIEGFLETCESKTYMSPFELLFCTYYHNIFQALQFSQKKLTAWYEACRDKEKVRTVIIHGKLANDHFLFDEKGYGFFINFEQTTIGPPSHDLLPFVTKSLKGFLKQSEDTVEWLYTYFKYFPFKDDELDLFLSYLSHPGSIIKTTERLFLEGSKRNERKAVQKLQREFWLLTNIEYIVRRINEIEMQKKMQEEAREDS